SFSKLFSRIVRSGHGASRCTLTGSALQHGRSGGLRSSRSSQLHDLHRRGARHHRPVAELPVAVVSPAHHPPDCEHSSVPSRSTTHVIPYPAEMEAMSVGLSRWIGVLWFGPSMTSPSTGRCPVRSPTSRERSAFNYFVLVVLGMVQ